MVEEKSINNFNCPICKTLLEKGNVKGYYSCNKCMVVWYIVIQSIYPECEKKEII